MGLDVGIGVLALMGLEFTVVSLGFGVYMQVCTPVVIE
jgi:hypothetical protein